jgi:hypothetical protein
MLEKLRTVHYHFSSQSLLLQYFLTLLNLFRAFCVSIWFSYKQFFSASLHIYACCVAISLQYLDFDTLGANFPLDIQFLCQTK